MFLRKGKQISLLSVICLLFVFSQITFAGDDWRDITSAELAMIKPQVESDADAEAIFWEVRVNDGSDTKLSLEHYVRIKIFTERGREEYSKVDIPFTKRMKIKGIAARIIKPDGTIVEITEKDIFEREIVKVGKAKVRAKSFAVPNIEPGVIIEYKYQEVIKNAGALGMSLVFQRDIPVQNITYYYKPYKKREPKYQPYNFSDVQFVEDKKGFYVAKRTNVPAFKEEPQMPPEDTVRPWILLQGFELNVVEASAFSAVFSVKDPSNPVSYWGGFGAEKIGLFKFMTKKDKDITKTAEEITASAKTPDEKLRKLYEFCQTEIKNSSYDASLTDDERDDLPKIKSLDDVLKKKQANAAYIDLIFGAMAHSLGLETRIAYSADRSEMFFNPDMTNEAFVHLAAIAVKVNNNWKFFNPGMSFLGAEELVWYEQGVWALLIAEKEFEWTKTPMSAYKDTNAKRTGNFNLLADGTLEGEITIEYTGQLALTERMDIFDESDNKREENLINELKSRISTAEVSNVSVQNISDHSKPLTYKYKIRIPNYAQKTGKRLFFQPGVFEYGEKPLFSSATRKYSIYFNFPWSEQDNIKIKLPAGFNLDNADAPADLADPGGISSLKYRVAVDKGNNALLYERNFYFGGKETILFEVSAYPALKNLFDAFNQADGHTITLKQE